jgi:hypothetical protein
VHLQKVERYVKLAKEEGTKDFYVLSSLVVENFQNRSKILTISQSLCAERNPGELGHMCPTEVTSNIGEVSTSFPW